MEFYRFIKLFETGVLKRIENRWMYLQVLTKEIKAYQPVDFFQIYYVILILFYGIFLSVIAFLLEHYVYYKT